MRITEIDFEDRQPIDAYGAGGFRVGGARYEGALALLPSGPRPWPEAPAAAAQLSCEVFAPVLAEAAEIDVLLVGMGADVAPLPDEARAALEQAGIGVEIMGTGAACRTYNVLLAEGRRVAAALLPV
ncbi:Mth938-like domain-containing protein [Oceanicella actignis]|uniref:Uncharacterized conserved protein, contains Mth938-like domain n=1 Tax=Oceanicella actignis TaxID=1189325 RepID=A0A1M7RVQ4_9RHOB|nr:MTH938/NDUFAF3 family protein [Oceanicella actignis]TYO89943.1 uncharacterized protein LY05_01138 [Oceanicella actignis]SET00542.1 Uncharacterized conserved protein, contains Mth938-like domain [Oceanicella actignis]SHN50437.1 Uncharacterized conserved protein, contains Mth938-like domain [Oceanicella actignis]